MKAAVFTLVIASMARSLFGAPGPSPSYYADVLPVLQHHCQTCHRPGEAAPMAFTDYASVRPWAKAIREAVLQRTMPPWFAAPGGALHFSNDSTLSDRDARTLVGWVDNGSPEGDPSAAPPPQHFTDGWRIGPPDLIVETPAPYAIRASGTLPYVYVIVPTRFTKDTWVRLAEVRPSDRTRTHHIVVSIREPGSPWLRHHDAGTPFTLSRADDDGAAAQGEFLAGYGPGGLPETFAEGDAKLIPAGSDLVFQTHYTPNGSPAEDRDRIGFVFAKTPPRRRVLMLAAANVRFSIPPGDPAYRVDARLTLQRDATLVSLLPHMHLRGKSFEFRAVLPTGERTTLLTVPHYSYDWQLGYYLAEPLHLPKGTVIECTATFDNSPNNPRNPDPAQRLRFGPQSTDEMMIGYFEVAVDPALTLRDLLLPAGR